MLLFVYQKFSKVEMLNLLLKQRPIIYNPISINKIHTRLASGKASKSSENEIITPDNLEYFESHHYCLAHIRKYDKENYLAALCIKDRLFRRAVVALRAFNVELSLVRDSTTNSDRAKLRLNFWAKLVEEIIRRDRQSENEHNLNKLTAYYNYTPIAKELLDLFHLVDIDEDIKERLHDLIGARLSSKVLGYKPFDTLKELELYCFKSNSSIYHIGWNLGLQLHNTWYTNYDILPRIKNISDKLGIAHGISNVIRGIPYNATKNCCYIPKDLLSEHNLTNRDFISSTNRKLDPEKISPIVKSLATRCQSLLDEAFQDSRSIPGYFRQLFLPRVSIQINLKKLKKCNYNICDPRLTKKDGLLPLNLWMASKLLRAPIL